jgi:hypothetical protein
VLKEPQSKIVGNKGYSQQANVVDRNSRELERICKKILPRFDCTQIASSKQLTFIASKPTRPPIALSPQRLILPQRRSLATIRFAP